MRTLKITGLLLICWLAAFGQYNIRINNIWDNPYYINPAAVNDEYQMDLSIAARKQWIGFPGSPSTYFATGRTYLSSIQTQFGVKAYSDVVGYNSITNVSLSYAYDLILNKEWNFDFGVAGSYQCLSYDRSQVSVMNNNDPALYENLLEQNNFNFDIGFELRSRSWRFGLSSQNIMSALDKENSILSNANYLYATYRKRTDDVLNLQYGLSVYQYGNIIQAEACLTAFFRFYEIEDLFHAGVFFRAPNEMGVIVGYNISESLNLAYSYDFNVSGISRNTVGSHELVLSYKFNQSKYKPYRY